MKCDDPAININARARLDITNQVDQRTAYHQAGRAVAIYLGNRQKQLPDVHFQIVIQLKDCQRQPLSRTSRKQSRYKASLEGGRLIQSLPQSFAEVTQTLSWPDQEQCRRAIEADMVNLLAGSLAEAKYVAMRDGRAFNVNLVYLGTLLFFGGKATVDDLDEYLECLTADQECRRQTLAPLFLAAYSFINQPANWSAITALAGKIMEVSTDDTSNVIDCEDVAALLEDRFAARVGLTG
jgi:hypothetical protein